ncbi:hypothetical protein ACR79B_20540 [Sphingobacterium spiritivorum]|uniref:hypothetical protein n=1 Tax=Sphingobacterium spiritivorum TaxID=258 RepID=UPI003DA43115
MNLENQSKEVMTYVETFLQNETVELIFDNEQLDKWNDLVEQLGLEGQQAVSHKEKSPIPFMHMKQTLIKVFEELCPRKVNYKKFDITPIPLEILDLIALSLRENYFDDLQIWYDDKTPDPVAIGLRYKSESDREKAYSWNMEKYIIGKWGDVKRSFEELTELASNRWLKRKKVEYSQLMKDYQRKLEDIENECYNTFGDNKSSDVSF